jgi:photosystem II stability/assembly factor-like uncharacterized protein
MRTLYTLCLLALCTTWAGLAQANGRFPRALRLVEAPGNSELLAVYGTYGLLVTRDAGQHWHHVCEAATGPFNGEAAMLEGLADGQLLLGTDADLKRSEDQACGWQAVLTPGASGLLDDVSRSLASNELFAALNNLDPDTGLFVTLRRSDDEGQTWLPFAELPQTVIERAFTLDVAASDADRIYVSGVNADGAGVIVRLIGQGQTAEAFELPLGSAAAAPYIAAVHPTDPDTLFVRTDELALIDNVTTANDRLLVSRDGGETWTQLIQRHAKLLGFALSPDGNTVLAGYGDPVLFSFSVDPSEVGIYRFDLDSLVDGSDAGAPLDKIHDESTTCLRWTEDTLYGCFLQSDVGFEVGVAAGNGSSGASTATELTWTPLLDLTQVRPLECAADSIAAQCLDDIIYGWPAACGKLGAPCELDQPEPDAGPAASPAPDSEGCACRVAALRGRSWPGLAWLGVLLALCGWRRSCGTTYPRVSLGRTPATRGVHTCNSKGR